MGSSASAARASRQRPQSTEFGLLENKLQDPQATPISLPLDFLKSITSDFSEEKELGRGGFGVVYKGVLQNGKAIAVKKLSDMNLDDDQFQKEVTYLFRMKHQNIVKLVGYCAESRWEATQVDDGKYVMAEVRKRLLCFEYINNKSLDKHISVPESYVLGWHRRSEIISGICCGLHYLHTECKIVHLDLKPQNILLDDNMEPKIADFGMSRLFGQDQSRIITESERRVGTLGYMAPEYLTNGLISVKADIFSLGVIIIELMTGSREYPSPEESYRHFVENVIGNWRKRLEEAGRRYRPLKKYAEQVKTCILMGLLCVDPDPNKRPTTRDILKKLAEADITNTNRGPPGKELVHFDGSGFTLEDLLRTGSGFTLEDLLRTEAEVLGRSTYGTVYKAVLEDGPVVAVKRFNSETIDVQMEFGKLVHFDGSVFTLEDLLRTEAEVLGRSTYGTVYKAMLEDGPVVAVKRFNSETIDDQMEFKAELAVLGNINHPNLLALIACYVDLDEKLAVFDYMPRGSLSAVLHGHATKTELNWVMRMEIAKGIAGGLAYLHDDMSIIHGNLSARNVFLDEQSHPKIADFGLFRLMTTAANSNMLATATELGYRAPELSSMMNASTKTDVYSLGIIILELLTGKLTSGIDLPRWVASVVREEWVAELFDLELILEVASWGSTEDELVGTLLLALRCVEQSPSARPHAREVLEELKNIRPGTGNAAGPSEDLLMSPSVQLEASDELEQTRTGSEDGAELRVGRSPPAVLIDAREVLELPEQTRSGLVDGTELNEHQPQLGPIRLRPDDDAVTSENRIENQEQISFRSEHGARPSGDPLASVQAEGHRDREVPPLPDDSRSGAEDGAGAWSINSLPSMQLEDRGEVLQPPQHARYGPVDGASRSSEDQLPWTYGPVAVAGYSNDRSIYILSVLDRSARPSEDHQLPEDPEPEVLQQPQRTSVEAPSPSLQPEAAEVLELTRPRLDDDDEPSEYPSVQIQPVAQAVPESQPESGSGLSDETPPPLQPETPEASQQREHSQAQQEHEDGAGPSEEDGAAHARPFIISLFFICFPFVVRE